MPRPTVAYFIDQGRVQRCKGLQGFLFSGAVQVPEEMEAKHLFKKLHEEVFEKGADITVISSQEDFRKKAGSLILATFNDKTGEKWDSTRQSVRERLDPPLPWSLQELEEWVERRRMESKKKSPTPTSFNQKKTEIQKPAEPQGTDKDLVEELDISGQVEIPASATGLNDSCSIQLGQSGTLLTVSEEAINKWCVSDNVDGGLKSLANLAPMLIREVAEGRQELQSSRYKLDSARVRQF